MRPHLMLTSGMALLAASLSLAACNKRSDSQAAAPPATGAPIASLPLAQGEPPPEPSLATTAQLPPAGPIRIAPSSSERSRYRYIDDAYAMSGAFADSPPDYTVDYQGSRPWIWRSQSGAYRVVEQGPDGERDYYYAAGADQPFLVRDPQYAYAYDGGALVQIYDAQGRALPSADSARQADFAARYLARARQLYSAAVHQQRQAAYAADWQARREAVLAPQRDWRVQQQQDPDWRRWHEQRMAQQQADWGGEHDQRQAYVAQAPASAAPQAGDQGAPAPPPAAAPPLRQDEGAGRRPPQAVQTGPRHPVQPGGARPAPVGPPAKAEGPPPAPATATAPPARPVQPDAGPDRHGRHDQAQGAPGRSPQAQPAPHAQAVNPAVPAPPRPQPAPAPAGAGESTHTHTHAEAPRPAPVPAVPAPTAARPLQQPERMKAPPPPRPAPAVVNAPKPPQPAAQPHQPPPPPPPKAHVEPPKPAPTPAAKPEHPDKHPPGETKPGEKPSN
jgi:hypothetical protein